MTKKLFVGNLSFNTREASLAAAFAAIGPVSDCKIIARGTKSLGYGFVDMTNDADAEKAVAALNKKDLDGRQINVEIAKELPEPKAPKPKREPRPPKEKAAPKEPKQEVAAPSTEAAAVDGAAPASGEKRRRRRGKAAQQPKLERAKNPSNTTLFIANLPFQFQDEDLKKMFVDFKLSGAHVVRKPNGNSRGYGFVDFDTEAEQQKALAAMDKKVVLEREISVKVALTVPVEVERSRAEKAEEKQ